MKLSETLESVTQSGDGLYVLAQEAGRRRMAWLADQGQAREGRECGLSEQEVDRG